MGNVWFTSDTHFGHARIAEFCPQRQEWFGMDGPGDIETMNEGLVEAWNSVVGPSDTVWHFGDIAMGQIENSLSYFSRCNGLIHVWLGNHDRPHPSYSRDAAKRVKWGQRYLDAGVDTLGLQGVMSVGGVTVNACHFPYHGDSEGEDRYPEFRPVDDGKVLIHGHIHDMWQVNGRQINVGFDAWGRILHQDEVAELVRNASNQGA